MINILRPLKCKVTHPCDYNFHVIDNKNSWKEHDWAYKVIRIVVKWSGHPTQIYNKKEMKFNLIWFPMKTFTLASARDDCLLSFMPNTGIARNLVNTISLLNVILELCHVFTCVLYSWRIGLLSMEMRIKEQNMQSGVCYHLGIRVYWVDHCCCSQ